MQTAIAQKTVNARLHTEEYWPLPAEDTAHLLIVMGPPGVGKTTLVESLSKVCPLKNAHLDSDHLAYTRPGGADKSRLDLIEHNMFHCIEGYRHWGAKYIFTTWITESQRHLDKLMTRLIVANIVPRAIVLEATCDVLVARLLGRPDSRFEPDAMGRQHLKSLSSRMHRLTSCTHLRTEGCDRYDILKRTQDAIATPDFWTA